MKIRISDRYSINLKKMHPMIKLLLIPITSLVVLAIVGGILFLSWFTWALLKL